MAATDSLFSLCLSLTLSECLGGGNSIYFHQYSMSMQHLRGQSVHQPCRTNNGNNNNNMLLPPIAGNGLCGLNFFGVFLLKFDAHVVVVSCRPLPQHPKPKAKPNISSGTSSPSVPSLAMQVQHTHTHSLHI